MQVTNRLWVGALLVSAGMAFFVGNLAPEVVPDTGGYLDIAPWPQTLATARTPAYGLLLRLFGGIDLVPFVHLAALVAAAHFLLRSARDFGLTDAGALSLALPVLFSNSAILFLNDVHPEFLSTMAVVAAVGCVLRFAGDVNKGWTWALLAGLSISTAYFLKPAFLGFLPFLPATVFLLARARSVPLRPAILRSATVAVVAALPFVVYAGARHFYVGSFHLVSFGGFASSGLSGLMLRQETIGKLPPEHRELASQILNGRASLEAQGQMLPIPLNSENVRSFPSAALGYFDTLARSYDNVVFGVVVQLKRPEETWVAFDRRLQSFTVAVIKAEPAYYAAWVVGATARFVGRITVGNAAFALASLGLAAVFVIAIVRGWPPSPSRPKPFEVTAIIIVVGAYTLANYLPAVLMTFPARRYVDTAGLMLAALPLYGVIRLWRPALGGLSGNE